MVVKSVSIKLFKEQPALKTFIPRLLTNTRMMHASLPCLVDKKIEKHTIQDASSFLNNMLLQCKGAAIFAGTGQYHEEKHQDRLVMLNLVDDFLQDSSINLFDSQELLDCCLRDSDVDLLIDNLKAHSKFPVYNGEVDIVDSSPWQHGFTLKPFSIFTTVERILLFNDNKLYVNTLGDVQNIPIDDIEYVGLWVSDEPYNERRLLLGLKGLQTKLLLSIDREIKSCDLAQLTVDTEWMMKAAALLCVHISQAGNSNIYLKVSPCLQPINNEWVAMRQKIWMDMIQKNTWGNNKNDDDE